MQEQLRVECDTSKVSDATSEAAFQSLPHSVHGNRPTQLAKFRAEVFNEIISQWPRKAWTVSHMRCSVLELYGLGVAGPQKRALTTRPSRCFRSCVSVGCKLRAFPIRFGACLHRTLVSQKRASTSSVAPSLSVAPLRALAQSFEFGSRQSGSSLAGRYLAPEILTRSGHGRNVDLYGLGAEYLE